MLESSFSQIRTGIDIAHNHFRAFIRKKSGGFGSNALPRAGDDSHLAVQHSLGVVQVGSDLLRSCVRHACG